MSGTSQLCLSTLTSRIAPTRSVSLGHYTPPKPASLVRRFCCRDIHAAAAAASRINASSNLFCHVAAVRFYSAFDVCLFRGPPPKYYACIPVLQHRTVPTHVRTHSGAAADSFSKLLSRRHHTVSIYARKGREADADRGRNAGNGSFMTVARRTPPPHPLLPVPFAIRSFSSLEHNNLHSGIVVFLPFFYVSAVIDLLPEFSNLLQSIPLERSVRPYLRKGTVYGVPQNLPRLLLCTGQDLL